MSSNQVPGRSTLPWLIQGGMGIAISDWRLARAVSRASQLGVVSGTAIDSVFVRRLQLLGVNPGLQRVLDRFPLQSVVRDVLTKYGARHRRDSKLAFRPIPMLTHRSRQSSHDLLVLAAYTEVALAKDGHDGVVGINLLTKVQLPIASTLFGAMLADVDYVLMGAGIPSHIPGILDRLALGEEVEMPLDVEDATPTSETPRLRFNPQRFLSGRVLRRPAFLAVVSSHVLATALTRRSSGRVDGFVVEGSTAGGHNAPPRGAMTLDDEGNPIYGERDRADLAVMRELGVPFWIAGSVTSSDDVRRAINQGAQGVQVGTLFAFCRESGMSDPLKDAVNESVQSQHVTVLTSPRASSTGYPFKVVKLGGTLSDADVLANRHRVCDLGYLRVAYAKPDGTIGYRCPSEPVEIYLDKGGKEEDTVGRVCLCNALMATAGLAQVRDAVSEPPIVTSGDQVNDVRALLGDHGTYSALDVIEHLRP